MKVDVATGTRVQRAVLGVAVAAIGVAAMVSLAAGAGAQQSLRGHTRDEDVLERGQRQGM